MPILNISTDKQIIRLYLIAICESIKYHKPDYSIDTSYFINGTILELSEQNISDIRIRQLYIHLRRLINNPSYPKQIKDAIDSITIIYGPLTSYEIGPEPYNTNPIYLNPTCTQTYCQLYPATKLIEKYEAIGVYLDKLDKPRGFTDFFEIITKISQAVKILHQNNYLTTEQITNIYITALQSPIITKDNISSIKNSDFYLFDTSLLQPFIDKYNKQEEKSYEQALRYELAIRRVGL